MTEAAGALSTTPAPKDVEIAIKELQPNDGDWLYLYNLDETP